MRLARDSPAPKRKFPVNLPVSREFGPGEKFARDCVHRQPVARFFSVPLISPEPVNLRPIAEILGMPTASCLPLRVQVSVATTQLHPAPAIAVAVKPAGSVSVTITVPLVDRVSV